MGEDLQVALVTWFGDDLELLVKCSRVRCNLRGN